MSTNNPVIHSSAHSDAQQFNANSRDIQERQKTDPRLRELMSILKMPDQFYSKFVTSVFEPYSFFNTNNMILHKNQTQVFMTLKSQSGINRQELELNEKFKKRKVETTDKILSNLQHSWQDQLAQSRMECFIQRNRWMISFVCDYMEQVGIPTQYANLLLLIPYQNILVLNIHSLYPIIKMIYPNETALVQHVAKFLREYNQLFPSATNSESKNNLISCFPYEPQTDLLPRHFHQRTKEEQLSAGLICLSYSDFLQWWHKKVPRDNKTEDTLLSQCQKNRDTLEAKDKKQWYRPLVLPLAKGTFRTVFNWPLCQEILSMMNMVKFREEMGNLLCLSRPNGHSNGHSNGYFDLSWRETDTQVLSFLPQIVSQFHIPCNFFFSDKLSRTAFKSLMKHQILPNTISFPLQSNVIDFIAEIKKDLPLEAISESSRSSELELTRSQAEEVIKKVISRLIQPRKVQKTNKRKLSARKRKRSGGGSKRVK